MDRTSPPTHGINRGRRRPVPDAGKEQERGPTGFGPMARPRETGRGGRRLGYAVPQVVAGKKRANSAARGLGFPPVPRQAGSATADGIAHSRDGDQLLQTIVITGSRDRDHERRRARLTV